MADIKFLERLKTFKKDDIPQNVLKKVAKILKDPEFDPAIIVTKNKPAGGLAKWCKAIYEYAEALKIVRPKELKQREMQEKYNEAMKDVEVKQKELWAIKD